MDRNTDQFLDMKFPLKGIDASQGYNNQPAGTTPVGTNVRGFDAGTQRDRGGSRSGLTKFINAQVSGTNVTQMLATIVTVSESAVG